MYGTLAISINQRISVEEWTAQYRSRIHYRTVFTTSIELRLVCDQATSQSLSLTLKAARVSRRFWNNEPETAA